MDSINILLTKKSQDYELLDSGGGEKLERFGVVVIARPDPEVLWVKNNPELWSNADATFKREGKTGSWIFKKELPKSWPIELNSIHFIIKLTSFKHTGIFPEQSQNWDFIKEKIQASGRPIKMLNLFGYTGGATIAALQAGAEVTHVDGSKAAIAWAKENAEASGVIEKPVRWILDDARMFVAREVKRGNLYDAIIMDPPSFGHGPNDEPWKIEEHFLELFSLCKKVLTEKPLFVIINGYTAGYSSVVFKNNLLDLVEKYGGKVECAELAIKESTTERVLPAGIVSRWVV